jgi:hypothetical protein
MVRSLYDCPEIPVGVTRAGVVYELFFTNLPQQAVTARDVVELYLHRGAFEPTLSDEDIEQDPDRWCSHSAWGQECWQVISQWTWNLRRELGHQLKPQPLRTTEFAPAIPKPRELGAAHPSTSAPAAGYGPPVTATRLGKRVASLAQTFLSNLTAPSGVQPGGRWFPMSGVERWWELACGVCGRHSQLSALDTAPSSANGKAVPPRSHAK